MVTAAVSAVTLGLTTRAARVTLAAAAQTILVLVGAAGTTGLTATISDASSATTTIA